MRIDINLMSYLHEKAQESRNKEIQACLMFLAGAIFFVGGTLATLSLTDYPEWFLFIPYCSRPLTGTVLGLFLVIGGLSLMMFGVIAGLYHRHSRSWYMEGLRKGNSIEELKPPQQKKANNSTKAKKPKKKK